MQAQANLTQARRQYDRSRELKEKGFVSQAALDDAKRNLDVAESQLSAAKLQVRSNSPAGSEFAVAQTALEQARASLAVAQAKLDDTVIRAPVDGTLIARDVEPGNVVQPGKELMALADEPTGNLDTKFADSVFDVLRDINEKDRTTFLIVTHDPRLARRCDRIIELVDGNIVSNRKNADVIRRS